MRNPQVVAPAVIAAGVFGVSTAAVLVRMSQAPPLVIAAYRLVISTVLLLPAWWWQRRLRLGNEHHNKTRSNDIVSWASSVLPIIAGICLAAHWTLWFIALSDTSVASATVLVTLHPVFTVFGAWLCWRQTPNRRSLWAIALAITGSVLIGADDAGGGALLGDLYAVLAAMAMAVYLIIGQQSRSSMRLLEYVVPVYASGAVATVAAAVFVRTPLFPYPAYEWGVFALLALVPTLGGHTLFNWALQYTPATTVSLAVLGEPVLAALWAAWLFGEALEPAQIVGTALTLAGLAIYSRVNTLT